MKRSDLVAFVKGIAPPLREAIDKRLGTTAVRIGELESRVASLEAAAKSTPTPKYRGVFNDAETYAAGDLVTRQGGLWLAADAPPVGAPGDGGGRGWRLIVKRGGA